MRNLNTKEKLNAFFMMLGIIIIPVIFYIILYNIKNNFKDVYEPSLLAPSAIIGSMIMAFIGIYQNYFNNLNNKEYDEAKEQLKNLYIPLNALIEKEYKLLILTKYNYIKNQKNNEKFETEYYDFFLKLRDIYLGNQVYGSLKLFTIFNSLVHFHETEYRNSSNKFERKKNILKDLSNFILNYKKDDNENSEFELLIQKVVNVVHEDMYTIANKKEPVKRYYQE